MTSVRRAELYYQTGELTEGIINSMNVTVFANWSRCGCRINSQYHSSSWLTEIVHVDRYPLLEREKSYSGHRNILVVEDFVP